jgi:alkylated DNA repair dioxygenase AlkB
VVVQVRGMSDRADAAALTLAHGSLVVMENACQHRYVHCVPREPQVPLIFRDKNQSRD